MKHSMTRKLCFGAMVAALYAVLTLSLPMLSYGPVQIRFSEALTVLPFLFPETIPGLALGCFIANLSSPYALDMVFGTLATLLAAIWTSRLHNKWLAPLPPVICNAVVIGLEIAVSIGGTPSAFAIAWAWNGFTVGVGELFACYALGMLLLFWLPKVAFFREQMPEERRNLLRKAAENA